MYVCMWRGGKRLHTAGSDGKRMRGIRDLIRSSSHRQPYRLGTVVPARNSESASERFVSWLGRAPRLTAPAWSRWGRWVVQCSSAVTSCRPLSSHAHGMLAVKGMYVLRSTEELSEVVLVLHRQASSRDAVESQRRCRRCRRCSAKLW